MQSHPMLYICVNRQLLQIKEKTARKASSQRWLTSYSSEKPNGSRIDGIDGTIIFFFFCPKDKDGDMDGTDNRILKERNVQCFWNAVKFKRITQLKTVCWVCQKAKRTDQSLLTHKAPLTDKFKKAFREDKTKHTVLHTPSSQK